MNITDQHRALLITLFISGTLLLIVFNLNLKLQEELAFESYYELEPEKELTPKEIKALEKLNASKAETNKAFNETQKSKRFAQAYQHIAPPEDYTPPTNKQGEATSSIENDFKPTSEAVLSKKDLLKFNKVNEILKKQNTSNNSRSTIWFSLINRDKVYIPVPVYLCEESGKIVINITVNENGNVIDTDINTSSTSNNKCLTEYALKYAKQAQFSKAPNKNKQIGTITFQFVGKH